MAFLPSLHEAAAWAPGALAAGYLLLLAVVACTAIFSGKPARRKAAYDVLLVLTRARRRPQLPYGDPPPRLPGPRRGRG